MKRKNRKLMLTDSGVVMAELALTEKQALLIEDAFNSKLISDEDNELIELDEVLDIQGDFVVDDTTWDQLVNLIR